MQPPAPYRPPLPRHTAQKPNGSTQAGRCPFLGSSADPSTSLAFPSDANHCFSTKFPVPISSIHQENYCLSARYESCPVFRQNAGQSDVPVPVLITPSLGASSPLSPPPRELFPAGAATAAAAGAAALGPSRFEPEFIFPEPPDFVIDEAAATPVPARASRSRVSGRVLVLALLFVAILIVGWWAWLNSMSEPDVAERAAGEVPLGQIIAPPTSIGGDGEPNASAGDENGAAIVAGLPSTATPTPSPEPTGSGDSADANSGGAAVDTAATEDSVRATVAAAAATATALWIDAVVPEACEVPSWWVRYVIEDGDTLDALAFARGILPEDVVRANCLSSADLTAGAEIFLPPVAVIIAVLPPNATPSPESTPTAASAGATLPTRRPPILFPTPTRVGGGLPFVPTVQPVFPTVPNVMVTDEPPAEDRPTRAPATSVPTSSAPPTATPPLPPSSARPSATPPIAGTPLATRTPPGGGAPTRTPPGYVGGTATRTPPAP